MPELAHLSMDQLSDLVVRYGTNLLWGLVILLGGWTAAGWAERAVTSALARVKRADAMMTSFFASLARYSLLAFTGIAVLEKLGVQTTSVVALLGAAGLAIGLALQGTLSHLAAGVMLLLFRPFKAGDSIESGSIAGTVREVHLFNSHVVTGDNVRVIVPNAMLWNAAIRNLTAHPSRKVEVVVPVPFAVDVDATLADIRAMAAAHPRVAAEPAPSVTVAKFGEKAADVVVAVWCSTGDVGAVKAELMAALWKRCLAREEKN